MKARVAEWAAAFPGVDVMTESRKALAWLNANPRQIKTWDGMPRFLFAWMSRAQNRGGSSPFAAPPPVATPGLCGFHQVAANANRPARAFAESCSECRHVRARMNPRPPSDPQRVGEGP